MTRFTDFCVECELIAGLEQRPQCVIDCGPDRTERYVIQPLAGANSYCIANPGASIAFKYFPRTDPQQGLL